MICVFVIIWKFWNVKLFFACTAKAKQFSFMFIKTHIGLLKMKIMNQLNTTINLLLLGSFVFFLSGLFAYPEIVFVLSEWSFNDLDEWKWFRDFLAESKEHLTTLAVFPRIIPLEKGSFKQSTYLLTGNGILAKRQM